MKTGNFQCENICFVNCNGIEKRYSAYFIAQISQKTINI